MTVQLTSGLVDFPKLRNRVRVFRDRVHAGQVLAGMLRPYRKSNAIVLGIPAGGVPVGAVIAEALTLPFDVVVVSKITLPWDTEAGYGAVAFDGTVKLNERLLAGLRLPAEDITKGIKKTAAKVSDRLRRFRGDKWLPEMRGRPAILVDDGLASGFTMAVGVEALQKAGADQIIVAVPTGHHGTVEELAAKVYAVYCPNIRGGGRFAVAEAYEIWSDVDEEEVMTILETFKS
jgi:putative phosphoribosyl transferase